jgi:hypothetical protein
MIRFLRRIRQKLIIEGQLRKYSVYAIGEIFLVVIGMLIALQVNTWNEKRKQTNQIENYAKSLIQDLQKDVEMIKVIDYTANQIKYRIDSLSNYIHYRPINKISNLKLLHYTWMHIYRPYSWNRATIEELKSSGSLRLIQNTILKKKIAEYDAFTRHMDEDYYTDKAQSENALQLLSKVVNYNYPNILQLSEVFRVSTVDGVMEDVITNPIYKEAEKSNIELITQDINELQNSVNSFIRLQFNLRI